MGNGGQQTKATRALEAATVDTNQLCCAQEVTKTYLLNKLNVGRK